MKLEDIEKKEIFKVPDGYFDALPSKIQSRIDGQSPKIEGSFVFRYKLQYVLPVIIFFVIGIFWFEARNRAKDAENILASIATEDLIAYLNESEIPTDEVLDHIEFNSLDLEEIETEVYELEVDDEFLDGDFEELGIENI
jgi:hypothetical protein